MATTIPTSTTQPPITTQGIGSGMDISGIVSKLVSAEQAPETMLLDTRQANDEAKISAVATVMGGLSSFQSALSGLSTQNTFQSLNATSSNTSTLTASATSDADLGSYQVQVNQLATSQDLASQDYSSASAVVGTGTLTIKFGTDPTSANFAQNADKGALTLTIDSSNNTLTGIRDAINQANAGVNATVMYDGTGYRLVLTSTDSGTKNAMQITADSSDGLTALNYNASSANMTEEQAAKDAQLVINGLSVTSSSNTVGNVLKGVTLNVQQTGSTSLAIARNTSGMSDAVNALVKAYNTLVTTVKGVDSYDPSTQSAGVLFGDFTVENLMSKLQMAIDTPIPGLTGPVKSLVDLGITTQSDGTLSVDNTKLNSALSSDPTDVAALFATIGTASDSGVTYVSASDNTEVGQYAVDITQAATQGYLDGGTLTTPAGSPITVDATNNTFGFSVDGISSGDITLTPSTSYTPTSLAAELQSRINGDSSLRAAGVGVSVNYDQANNRFVFVSNRYGLSSQVGITSAGSGAAALGLSVATGTAGQDIAGTIGDQAAQGDGQLLTASAGNADGLQLSIADSQTGDRGTVNFTHGLVDQLNNIVSGYLDTNGNKGMFSDETDALQQDLNLVQQDRQNLTDRMNALQTQLTAQYNAMDTLVGQLQSTGTYLSQQLATLPLANISSTSTKTA